LTARHYLDHASTSPLRPAARQAVVNWLAGGTEADPGRVHSDGRAARVPIETAREQVAALLGARPREVVFTSGATEAIAAAVFGATRAHPGAPVVCAGVEHSAVREASRRSAPLVDLRVEPTGAVDLDDLDETLARLPEVALVHCQWANHEVGTVQPVAEVVARCRERGVLVHVDAAAAAGHVPVDFDGSGADLCSVSAHKLGGPPGAGALLVRRGLRLEPLLVGGAQERARRAGLENTLGIVGFGAAAAELVEEDRLSSEEVAARGQVEALVAVLRGVAGVELLGADAGRRLPHIACAVVAGVEPEAVLLGLDQAGISVHSGSACSSETLEPSPVLAAMGAEAERSLRVSVGWNTTGDDVAAFAAAFPDVVARLRALAG
jgi:cysteine desulfurase